MSETRATPFYCAYCGDENLRPHEHQHGAWECRSCLRVFAVRFVGLLTAAGVGSGGTGSAAAGAGGSGSGEVAR